jgi:KipI family sensor histidine kinase inhibitor
VPRILPVADSAVIVEFEGALEDAGRRALALEAAIAASRHPGIGDTVPGLRSLLVEYDCLQTSQADVVQALEHLLTGSPSPEPRPARWRIPVCHDQSMAPDLDDVAARCGCDVEALVALLDGSTYSVAMIGNLPGLPYLIGLSDRLHVPRRPEPRTQVPAGSVGLAAGMACIYPVSAPGGWNLVGRTPIPLFDAARRPPCLLTPGDRVQLMEVSPKRFAEIEAAAGDGNWTPDRVDS